MAGKQSQVTGHATGYIYDAEGNRVAKGNITNWNGTCNIASNGFTTTNWYVLGPSGEQLTETDGNGTWLHTNVFAGGALAATYDAATNNTLFALNDWLGTKRMEVGANNNCATGYASMPFGDGLTPEAVTGYTQCPEDATEHHLTGKERDVESGNDYMFARYYNSTSGRFLSPDWSAKEEPVPYAKLDNPQTLNLYTYVVNNPLSAADNDGHEIYYLGLKNEQVVRDSVTAILANPNTAGYLSGYVGKGPDLVITNGDLSNQDSATQNPDGTPGGSIIMGTTLPSMSIGTDDKGNKSDPVFAGATITIDNRTSAGDTPSVMTHEAVHAGEARVNPTQYNKDTAAERSLPHDKRPQEQRANAVQKAQGPAITKAVKQIEKDRKKKEQQ